VVAELGVQGGVQQHLHTLGCMHLQACDAHGEVVAAGNRGGAGTILVPRKGWVDDESECMGGGRPETGFMCTTAGR
jgi:hypothetical protein